MSDNAQITADSNPATDPAATTPAFHYQLVVYVGDGDAPTIDGTTTVNLTPSGDDPLAPLAASTLTAADLRTRTVVMFGPGALSRAAAVYAAMCGFAGRMIDFIAGGRLVDARAVHTSANAGTGTGDTKPAHIVEQHLVAADTDLDTDTETIRWSRGCAVEVSTDTVTTMLRLVAAAGLRARNGSERFPLLAAPGTLPAGDGTWSGPVVDLDLLRRSGAELRRARRIDDRGGLVDPVTVDDRCRHLATAASVDLADVLIRLGSHQDPESGAWRCPRPGRHRNGDANPSARLNEHGFRCFRCDPEPVDALRLVIDVLGISPDDAARWLTSSTS